MDEHPLLDRLRISKVISVDELNNGLFRMREMGTDYFNCAFTPLELLRLSNELMDLVLNAIDPEG
jgi:hypothetical protein